MLRSPAPAASRGGPSARAARPRKRLRQKFSKPTAKPETIVSDSFALERRRGNFARTFWATVFYPLGRVGGGGGGGRRAHKGAADAGRPHSKPPRTAPRTHGGGEHANKTSNQTFKGSLVSCPRLPTFRSFPFRFPFRGEKGSAPAGGSKGGGERRSGRQREGGSKEANRQRFEETSRMLPGGRGQRRRRAETAPEGPKT